MFDQKILESLFDGTFSHDFQEITLTRLDGANPDVRRGPGSIRCTDEGDLELKLYLTHSLSADTFLSALSSGLSMSAGTLRNESDFYRMDARDYHGRLWTCDKLHADETLFHSTGSGTMTAELPSVQMSEDYERIPASSHSVSIALHGQPEIPYNAMENRGDRLTRSELKFGLDEKTVVRVLQREGYVVVHAVRADEAVDEAMLESVLEGMSIASGYHLEHSYKVTRGPLPVAGGSREISVITSGRQERQRGDRKIWSILGRRPDQHEDFVAFALAYAKLRQEHPNSYFSYWRMVFEAWQAGVFVAALPLSVYIEGVAQEFFPDEMQEDSAVVDAVEKVIECAKKCAGPSEVLNRCVGAIKGVRKKSPTAALKFLAQRGWFDERLVKQWRDVRGKSAHGADIAKIQEPVEMQTMLDDTLACLHLFYVLLMIRMRYSGQFSDFSRRGFPMSRFPSSPLAS